MPRLHLDGVFFGRRLQTSAYLRDSLIEGAKQQGLKILFRELHDKALESLLDPRNPPPDRYGSTRRLWESDKHGETSSDWIPSNETADEKEESLRRKEERDRIRAAKGLFFSNSTRSSSSYSQSSFFAYSRFSMERMYLRYWRPLPDMSLAGRHLGQDKSSQPAMRALHAPNDILDIGRKDCVVATCSRALGGN